MATKLDLYEAQQTEGFQREAVYNALDTIATLEIHDVLNERMSDADRRTHDFYMAVQGAAIEMTIRGIKVDDTERVKLVGEIKKELRAVEAALAKHQLIKPAWDKVEINSGACHAPSRKDGKHKWPRGVPDSAEKKCEDCGQSRLKIRPFKPSSDDDVKHLLYDLLKMKQITNKDGHVTTDKEARGRLKDKYPRFREVLELLDSFQDLAKQSGFLAFRSPDGRFHAGFNVGVTGTHRWSSNKNADGDAGNAQNITEKHRHIFTADRGYELVYADLKQAESNVIAHVAGDEMYIEAHRVGDTHTFVCRLVWPEGINGQAWNWDDIAIDKKIATSANPTWDDRPGHDYRFQSKAVQHGSNLGLTPYGMALQKRIPVAAAAEGQGRYFRAFPGVKDYQAWIRELVQNQDAIITPLGVRFKLFGRPWDEHTYKEGLSIIPQATVGHIISIGLYKIWRQLPEVQLLAQVHDAILFQVPTGRHDLTYKALKLMEVPIPVKGLDGTERVINIGTEAAVGQNWGHYNDKESKGRINLTGVREITFNDDGTEWSLH